MDAAADKRLPDEGEGGLLARVADPPFEEARAKSGPARRTAPRAGLRAAAAIAVIAEQIRDNRERDRQHDGEEQAGERGFRPVTMASHRRRNHTGGHHAAVGWLPISGIAPTVAMNSSA